jgi:general secretion pathway protein L
MIAALQSRAARLGVTYIAPLQRRVLEFWRWWSKELVALLPTSMQQAIAASNERLFAQVSGKNLVVFQGSIERMQELAQFPLDANDSALPDIQVHARQVVLLLPPDRILDTTVTLPAATEENLREVLAFEMDQLTPFTVDQVYYGFNIVDRSSAKGTIDLHLLVSPRSAVDELLSALQRIGLRPSIVSAKADSERMHDINLLPRENAQKARAATQWLNTGLAVAALVLLVAIIAIPLLQKRQQVTELGPQVTAAVEAAQEGSRLKRNIELVTTGSTELVARKESRPTTIAIIDEMSRILPDNTWLSRIDIAGDEIQIQGQSEAAESLISLIEESPTFENARFRSPVTQIPQTEAERFHLSANWSTPE